MKLTYRQAYDRIVTAYFKEELNPYSCGACFVGNLLGGHSSWANTRLKHSIFSFPGYIHETNQSLLNNGLTLLGEYGYSRMQITDIENNFIAIIERGKPVGYDALDPFYEDRLFSAMSSTLDMLKEIHEQNGEIVDPPIFQKRTLKTA